MESKKTERDCVHFIGRLGTHSRVRELVKDGFCTIASQAPMTPLCQKNLPGTEDHLSKKRPVDVTCHGPNHPCCPGAVFRQINSS